MDMSKVRHFPHKGAFLKTKVINGDLWLLVRQATNNGYIPCHTDGVFDIAYPTSLLRRARAKDGGDISASVMAGEPSQCVFKEYKV